MLCTALQFGAIQLQVYSLMRVTRETTRWLAIHPITLDSGVLAHARANPLTLKPARLTLVQTAPACTSIVSNQCVPDANSGGRGPSKAISVTLQYDVTDVIFFPANISFGGTTVGIPTGPRTYKVTVMQE